MVEMEEDTSMSWGVKQWRILPHHFHDFAQCADTQAQRLYELVHGDMVRGRNLS